MNLKKQIFALVCCALTLSATAQSGLASYRIIPLPKQISLVAGKEFVLNKSVKIVYPGANPKMKQNAALLSDFIKESTGLQLQATTAAANKTIELKLTSTMDGAEAYQLEVTPSKIIIRAKTEAGVFYGIQTLRKSLPQTKCAQVVLPAVQIADAPRFGYRGMMLDVGRHMYSVDFIKRYIDILALHNINNFHWHLTEDQGWRIEIKKYPKLTQIGSKRAETVIGRNTDKYDGKPYEGFYTQAQVREIVAYAAQRYINIVPEIDLPGHMMGALASYPELGCTGGPYKVNTRWGVMDDVLCAGNEKTFEFIEGVFTELMELFPSKYIHIGGDECPKVRWKECPKCQARIKAEGLKTDDKHTAEERLQSYVISRTEKFLNSKGRRIIGWDEILEGGLAPNATVMSWRGMEGGIEAAKHGHDAIMTPTSHMYFDYYQTQDTQNEPLAFGGYLPVEIVYSFEPVHPSLTAGQQKHIIGCQANLWTEYVPDSKQAEYQTMPRIAALCEVQWTSPEQKNYKDFVARMPRLLDVYNTKKYTFATHLFDVSADFQPDFDNGTMKVTLKTIDDAPIFFTLDGSVPNEKATRYTSPVSIRKSCVFKAVVIRSSGSSRVFSENISFNKASMKPIEIKSKINDRYKFNGAPTLVDGLTGNNNYKTGRWIGFAGNDLDAVIDLKQSTDISQLSVNCCVVKGDWIFGPEKFSVSVSDDGVNFRVISSKEYPVMTQNDKDGVINYSLKFDNTKTRFVKVQMNSLKQMPEWHAGKGKPAYIFVDEVNIQ